MSFRRYNDVLSALFGQIQEIKACVQLTQTVYRWLSWHHYKGVIINEKLWVTQLYWTHLWTNQRFITCFWVLSVGL